MVRIAVVEDELASQTVLTDYLHRYEAEAGVSFSITCFSNGLELVEHYTPVFDLILLDIEMPYLNGMEAAQRIRTLDEEVIFIFVTNMAQYAIHGYEVGAFDFILKPLVYFPFASKLKKALSILARRSESALLIPQEGGVKRLSSRSIFYIEVQGHRLMIHTQEGDFPRTGTLKELEKQLDQGQFVRCNQCYLVNLRHVTHVQQHTVTVGDTVLQISRPRKKAFLQALTDYFGGIHP